MSASLTEAWLSRFGDAAALSRRMEWDGLTAADFDEGPVRLLRRLSAMARRAEAALLGRNRTAATAVLVALDRGDARNAPIERLLPDAVGWAALHKLAAEAIGSSPAGPVQAALGRISLAHGIAAIEEAQCRLQRDATALASRFGFRADALRKADAMGDPHAGGRRVLRLEDADGRAVFLKPRALDGEKLLDRLACMLGPEGYGARLPPMLTRAGYGWVAEARSDKPVDLRAAGALIAIADLAAAVDLHAENLLPVAGGAAVLDAEMALHPDLPLSLVPTEARPAAAALRSGVLRTGLLPEPDQPRALCGLAAWMAEERMTPDDAAAVADGYAHAFARLCARGGAAAALTAALPARGTVRLLMRRTAGYVRLLERLRDPQATPDSVALMLHLEMLRITMARHHRRRPALWGVAGAEAAALLRGDIPRLWMGWDATSIHEGTSRAPGCARIAKSPRIAALSRAARLGARRTAAQARRLVGVLVQG